MGEGFHNYHHTFPYDYGTSEWGFRLNVTTRFINAMPNQTPLQKADEGQNIALSDTLVFLLNEYFNELNTVNFYFLNKFFN